jgi:ribonuclease E
MVLESNRDLVLRRLVECLSRDRTKHQVAEVTSLGLVQMTRKKLGLGLLETFSEPCEACAGRGIIVHHEPHMRAKVVVEGGNDKGQKDGKKKNKGKKDQKQSEPKIEVAKVVTPELASEINSVMAKIAASTVAAHQAAGEESLIPATNSVLDSVLEALPEPTAPGQSQRKSRRVRAEVPVEGSGQ